MKFREVRLGDAIGDDTVVAIEKIKRRHIKPEHDSDLIILTFDRTWLGMCGPEHYYIAGGPKDKVTGT